MGSEEYWAKRAGAADAGPEPNKVAMKDSEHYRRTGHHLDAYGRRRYANEIFGCFVATAVYGSYDAPEVLTLRKFRDEVLKKTSAGRMFISWYYQYGPYLARLVKKSNLLTGFSRWLLDAFVARLCQKEKL